MLNLWPTRRTESPNGSCFPCVILFYPLSDEFRKTLDGFIPEKSLIDVPHMEHVDDTTEIRPSTGTPPRLISVHNEEMLGFDPLVLAQFLQFHPIKQTFIHTVRDSTPECGGVVGCCASWGRRVP